MTADGSGNASATFHNLNGMCVAVEVKLGTSTSANISLVDDQGVTVFSFTAGSSGQYAPGITLTDGTNTGAAYPVLAGATHTLLSAQGASKTATVILHIA